MATCSRPNVIMLDSRPDKLSDTRLIRFCGSAQKYIKDPTSYTLLAADAIDLYTGEFKLESLPVFVPCGTCPACRANKAAEYGVRTHLESLTTSPDRCNVFLTLTYDDVWLSFRKNSDVCRGFWLKDHPGTLERVDGSTHPAYNGDLCYEDVKCFLRELRRKIQLAVDEGVLEPYTWIDGSGNLVKSAGLRYFYVGEYGDKSHRPHYHLILFGVPKYMLDGAHPAGHRNGHAYYTHDLFKELWPYGSAVYGDASLGSSFYTAGYALKKAFSEDDKVIDRVPAKLRMSTQPGIGYQYYTTQVEPKILANAARGIYTLPKIQLPNGKFAPIPHYFLRKLELTNPNIYDKIKVECYFNSFYSWSDLMSEDDFIGLDDNFYKNSISNLCTITRTL